MLRRLIRSWPERARVAGDSMLPLLRPGDLLLVDPQAYAERRPRPGEIVVAPDPRQPERLLIKRVESIDTTGRVVLSGDLPERSTDSRVFGAVPVESVIGRAWARYWPPRRIGLLR